MSELLVATPGTDETIGHAGTAPEMAVMLDAARAFAERFGANAEGATRQLGSASLAGAEIPVANCFAYQHHPDDPGARVFAHLWI